jgi:ferrochelatase
MSRTAVVLFNLGGPDSEAAVAPFLFNLFNDPAIIALPQPLRWLIARLIAARRAPIARDIYRRIGGGSPLLANTKAQAAALEAELGADARVFIAMRYWAPRAAETAAAVKAWAPDEIVLLPLYPQASTTTTASSLRDWQEAAAAIGLAVPARAICCYPEEPGFIAALAAEIRRVLQRWPPAEKKRILFSAHGLPEKIVRAGDPYQWQVERTAAALRAALAASALDTVVCYQSRVGPLAWLGPATDAEIRRAGVEKVGLIVVPIAFVSEHSETLVELDMEYRHLAGAVGVPIYVRVPTVGVAPDFVAALARLTRGAKPGACPSEGKRLCPAEFRGCLCRAEAA